MKPTKKCRVCNVVLIEGSEKTTPKGNCYSSNMQSYKKICNSCICSYYKNKRNEEYKKFYEECERQHEEMVANLTYTIRSSGGLDGWLVEEETSLVKTFEFSSYEQANQFMHEAGIVCEEMNHHPEWWTTEGGKVVNTRLTTHDAGNKITVNDYKAAKAMNVVESEVKSNIVFKLIKKVLPF